MSASQSFDLPVQQCPSCHAKLEATTNTRGQTRPSEGDVSICFYCGEVAVFDGVGRLRTPDPMEMLSIQLSDAWSDVRRIQHAVKRRGWIPRPEK